MKKEPRIKWEGTVGGDPRNPFFKRTKKVTTIRPDIEELTPIVADNSIILGCTSILVIVTMLVILLLMLIN